MRVFAFSVKARQLVRDIAQWPRVFLRDEADDQSDTLDRGGECEREVIREQNDSFAIPVHRLRVSALGRS